MLRSLYDWTLSLAARKSFFDGWLKATEGRSFVPPKAQLDSALQEADLANALYETSYELGSRPDWVTIPLTRLRRIVSGA